MLRAWMKACKAVARGLLSDVPLAPQPFDLVSFNSPAAVQRWHVFTDSFFGGCSRATFSYNDAEQAAEFSGRLTTKLSAEADENVRRSGYAAASSKVVAIGDYTDLSGFTHLTYDLKGDGRTYIATVRVDSIFGTGGDVWQALLRTTPGSWTSVRVPIHELVLTYRGQLVERRLDFQADKVIALGISTAIADGMSLQQAPVLDAPLTQVDADTDAAAAVRQEEDARVREGDLDSSGGSSGVVGGDEGESEGASAGHVEDFRLLLRSVRAEVDLYS